MKNVTRLVVLVLLVTIVSVGTFPSLAITNYMDNTSTGIEELENADNTICRKSENIEEALITESFFDCNAECRIKNYVDPNQFDSQNYTCRLPQEESLNTYVFQTEEGKRAVYYFDDNVKFIDDCGNVLEKDISIRANREGFSPNCNDIGLIFPKDVKDPVRFKYNKFDVSITPNAIQSAKGKLDFFSVLYPDSFGKDACLSYKPLLSGMMETILLLDSSASNEYSFRFKTDGLIINSDEEGFYFTTQENFKDCLMLGEVFVCDSANHIGFASMSVETISEGGEYIITISVDPLFLKNESVVFPVTIETSLVVSDNTHSVNGIQDAPIFQNKPASNFGSFLYNRVGTPDTNYGVGRTVVKLSGLTSSIEYTTISASQISSVLFYARESSGGTAQTIDVHPIINVNNWNESNVSWNDIGQNFDASVNYGATMNNSQWTGFDITDLAKKWKNSIYNADCGFILKNAIESNDKCFDSCECTTTQNRPYVVFTYTPQISISFSSCSIPEGGTFSLSAFVSPASMTPLWISGNSSIASVSSDGTVTGIKAGTTDIYAFVFVDGEPYCAYCKVYIYLQNGVYYFDNLYKNNRIEFYDNSSYNEYEPLTAYETDFGVPSLPNNRYQLFKLSYLGSGLYNIRSMLDNSMGWYCQNSSLVCKTIGTSNSSTPYAAKWRIGSNAQGYYIYSQYGDSKTVTCPENYEADWDIVLSDYSSTSLLQVWSANRVSTDYRGVAVKYKKTSMTIGEVADFSAATYSTYHGENSLSVEWSSENERIAYIDINSGAVTAINHGKIYITVSLFSYPYITDRCTLTVGNPSVETIGISSGSVYMIKNASKNLYLTATSNTSFSLASKNTMDGRQLWYVEWTGSGYKLYSMGRKNNSGLQELMICGNSSGSSPILQTGSLNDNWSISNNAGYYYLVNVSSMYNDSSITAQSDDYSVKCIDLGSENEYAKWIFEEVETSSFNNYWNGNYYGQGSIIHIKIMIDDSGSDSVYNNSIIDSSNFDVIDYLNGISTKIVIYGPDDSVPYGITPFEVTFKGYTPTDDFTYGVTVPYGAYSETGIGNTWHKVHIYLNTSSSGALSGADDIVIQKVILHELGHALKLAHPKQLTDLASVTNGRGGYPNDASVSALMNQGNPYSYSNLTCATPKWHDIINLKNKW